MTNRLHQLASRLQITYRDLMAYLSRDATSIADKVDSLEVSVRVRSDVQSVLDSGAVTPEMVLEEMFGL